MGERIPAPNMHGARSEDSYVWLGNRPGPGKHRRGVKHPGRKRRAGSKGCRGCLYCGPAGDPRSNRGKALHRLRALDLKERLDLENFNTGLSYEQFK